MKKRVVQLVTGLATAGMLAATGFAGTQAIRGVMPVETTETVEFAMAENEANWLDWLLSNSSSEDFAQITEYTTIGQVAEKFYLDSGIYWSVTLIHSVGFQGNVYALCNNHQADAERKYLFICTQTKKNGPIRICGFLTINNSLTEFRYDDGIIWTFYSDKNMAEIKSYCVSSDGSRIVQKDSARADEYDKFKSLKRKYDNATVIY